MVEIIDATILVLTLLIIARSFMSFFPNVDRRNPMVEFVITLTEPILGPLRAILPRVGMFDLSPMAAIFLMHLVIRPLLVALVMPA